MTTPADLQEIERDIEAEESNPPTFATRTRMTVAKAYLLSSIMTKATPADQREKAQELLDRVQAILKAIAGKTNADLVR